MVGTDPFTRVGVEAKPALYWPSLLKQSDVNRLAHTYKQEAQLTRCRKKNYTTIVSSVVLQLGQNIGSYVNLYNQQQSNLRV